MAVNLANKREEIKYVEFSTKNEFGFKVIPDSDITISQKKLIVEQQLYNYVVNRVTNLGGRKYNQGEIDGRAIRYVNALSSKKIARQFKTEFTRIYEEAEFLKRGIKIFSYSQIADKKYRFDFKTLDSYEDGNVFENRWVVYLKYKLIPPSDILNSQYRALNPLGIQIDYYRGDIDDITKGVDDVF